MMTRAWSSRYAPLGVAWRVASFAVSTSGALTREQFLALVDLAGHLHEQAARCAKVKAWRAALILLGGEIEAGLMAMVGALETELRSESHWKTSDPPLLHWGLRRLVKTARDAGWLTMELPAGVGVSDPTASLTGGTGDAIDFVRQMRDTFAHPGRHIRELPFLDSDDDEIMRPTYEVARLVVDATFGDLVGVWDRYP